MSVYLPATDAEYVHLVTPRRMWDAHEVSCAIVVKERPAAKIAVPRQQQRTCFAVFEAAAPLGCEAGGAAPLHGFRRHLVLHGLFRVDEHDYESATRQRQPADFFAPEQSPAYLAWWSGDRIQREVALKWGLNCGSSRGESLPHVRHEQRVFRGRTVAQVAAALVAHVGEDAFVRHVVGGDATAATVEALRSFVAAAHEVKVPLPPAAAPSHPTAYKGVTYASLLEAQWSFLLMGLGMKVLYESAMITSPGFDRLLADTPGTSGRRRYYKPDLYLPELRWAVEIKPNSATRHERLLCAEWARVHGPILLLTGGGTRGRAMGFASGDVDRRDFKADGAPCPPTAVLYSSDAACAASQVRTEAVTLMRSPADAQRWTFGGQAEADARLSDGDRALLRDAFDEARDFFDRQKKETAP